MGIRGDDYYYQLAAANISHRSLYNNTFAKQRILMAFGWVLVGGIVQWICVTV